MKFVDDNFIEGEMFDADFIDNVIKISKEREEKKVEHRFGVLEVYSEERIYHDIPYELVVIRHFDIREPYNKQINTIGKWVISRYNDKIKDFVSIVNQLNILTHSATLHFLNEDTKHDGQENWTLKQMVEWIDNEIKEQINRLDAILPNFLDDIKNTITKFNFLIKKFDEKLKEYRCKD